MIGRGTSDLVPGGIYSGLQSFFNAKARGDVAASRALRDEIPDIYVPPPHRVPKGKQISNMLKMVRQRERLDRNPLFAVHLLAKRDGGNRIYWCVTFPCSLANVT